MKKMILLPCLMLSLRLFGQFQPMEPFIAPDFTVTDINGNTWNLYDLLEDGKTVLLDFMATWCSPCWQYHQAHHLETLHEQLGPNGTDELRILMIEGDGNTGLAALQGFGSNTYGNWITGTPYPIINNNSLNDPYLISSYPTMFIICPDKLARHVWRYPADEMYWELQNCPTATQPDNGALLGWTGTPFSACAQDAFEPQIRLSNYGNNPITSAEIRLRKNGTLVQTLQWTGELATFENADAVFNPITIGNVATTNLDFEIVKINDQNDPDPERNTLNHPINRALQATGQTLTVQLDLGFHAPETYWEIRKVNTGAVIASGGNVLVGPQGGGMFAPPLTVPSSPTAYGYGGSSPDLTVQVPIPESGCYQFHLVDGRGNGFSYETVKLISNGVTLATANESGWSYFDRVVEVYNVVTATHELDGLSALSAFPNPVSDELQVDFVLEKAGQLAISLSNALGETVFNNNTQAFSSGKNRFTVAVSNLPDGIYFLRIGNEEGQVARKIVVNKP